MIQVQGLKGSRAKPNWPRQRRNVLPVFKMRGPQREKREVTGQMNEVMGQTSGGMEQMSGGMKQTSGGWNKRAAGWNKPATG